MRLIDANGTLDSVAEEILHIVRCKDCKYWTECSFFVPPINFCGRLRKEYKRGSKGVEFEMDADDFCSRGERK